MGGLGRRDAGAGWRMLTLLRAQPLHEHEQCRDEDAAEQRRSEHPRRDQRTHHASSGRAGAGRDPQRNAVAFIAQLRRERLLRDGAASYLASMLQQKITRLAAEFAAQIIGTLTAAPLDDLVALTSGRAPAKSRPPVARTKAARASSLKKSAPTRRAPAGSSSPSSPSAPSAATTTAALAFFVERGTRGATAQQLGDHLAQLGLAGSTDVVTTLAETGGIRDAGFRRAAGKNATAPVFIAS